MKNTFNLLLLGLLVLPALNCKDIPDPEVNPQAFEIYKQDYISRNFSKKMMQNYFPGIYKQTQINEEAALDWIENNKNNREPDYTSKGNCQNKIMNNRDLCRAMANGYLSIKHYDNAQKREEDSRRIRALTWQAQHCNDLLFKMRRTT